MSSACDVEGPFVASIASVPIRPLQSEVSISPRSAGKLQLELFDIRGTHCTLIVRLDARLRVGDPPNQTQDRQVDPVLSSRNSWA